MVSIETAGEYFDTHLLGDFFRESGRENMLSSIKMAELDVKTQLEFLPDDSDADYIAAVCEQAIFLLMHKDQLVPPVRSLVSESIEGLGSCSYAANMKIFAPRAEMFIESINKRNSADIAAVAINRG